MRGARERTQREDADPSRVRLDQLDQDEQREPGQRQLEHERENSGKTLVGHATTPKIEVRRAVAPSRAIRSPNNSHSPRDSGSSTSRRL